MLSYHTSINLCCQLLCIVYHGFLIPTTTSRKIFTGHLPMWQMLDSSCFPPSDNWPPITDPVILSYEMGWLRHCRKLRAVYDCIAVYSLCICGFRDKAENPAAYANGRDHMRAEIRVYGRAWRFDLDMDEKEEGKNAAS